jgi:hypothetical protein
MSENNGTGEGSMGETASRAMAVNNTLVVDLLRSMALASSLLCAVILSTRRLNLRGGGGGGSGGGGGGGHSTSASSSCVYRFLLAASLSDCVYTSLLLLYRVLTGLCSTGQCHHALYYTCLVFYVLVSEYLTSCLALFNILVEIHLTLHRICLLRMSTATRNSSAHWRFLADLRARHLCPPLLALAMLVYLPHLFMYRIETSRHFSIHQNNHDQHHPYKIVLTDFGSSAHVKHYTAAVSVARILLVTLVLSALNTAVLVYLKVYFSRQQPAPLTPPLPPGSRADSQVLHGQHSHEHLDKKKIDRKKTSGHGRQRLKLALANRKLTVMLITISFMYAAGHLPYLVSIFFFFLDKFKGQMENPNKNPRKPNKRYKFFFLNKSVKS